MISTQSGLPLATRTTTTTSATQANPRGVLGMVVYLNVTAASGTGGLKVQILGIDPISGNGFALNALPTAVTATGTYAYVIGPGCSSASGSVQQATSGVVPPRFQIQVTHVDGSSYTYSVGYILMEL